MRRVWPYIVLVILLSVNVFAWSQRQQIADWWRLRDYKPSAEIVALATDSTMTDSAKHLFYINHPSLEDKADFNMHCSDRGKETAVLGCYHGDRRGIYIYAVTDKRLEGVRQVTAAHEMLHQAYDRLSAEERDHINKLLSDYYVTSLHDESVKSKLDSYRTQSDVILVNEMHSIFGSELRNLPPALEEYYKQYFIDRQKVVSFRESYQTEFTRRQDLVAQYDAQLSDLKKRISDNKSILEARLKYLKDKEKEINQDINDRNQSAYEADIRDYNATVATYNSLLGTTRKLIEDHNAVVAKRNDIAVEEQQLQQALDSRLDTPTSKQ